MSVLSELYGLKSKYSKPENRQPGWDQKARTDAIHLIVEHHFGKTPWDKDLTMTDAFLDVLINRYEDEDAD